VHQRDLARWTTETQKAHPRENAGKRGKVRCGYEHRLQLLAAHALGVPALRCAATIREMVGWLAGTLDGDRTREFTEQLRVAGVPV